MNVARNGNTPLVTAMIAPRVNMQIFSVERRREGEAEESRRDYDGIERERLSYRAEARWVRL